MGHVCWLNTDPILTLDMSVCNSNAWVKSGSAKTGTLVKRSFIRQNMALALSVHANLLPFIHSMSGATILLKCEMNYL